MRQRESTDAHAHAHTADHTHTYTAHHAHALSGQHALVRVLQEMLSGSQQRVAQRRAVVLAGVVRHGGVHPRRCRRAHVQPGSRRTVHIPPAGVDAGGVLVGHRVEGPLVRVAGVDAAECARLHLAEESLVHVVVVHRGGAAAAATATAAAGVREVQVTAVGRRRCCRRGGRAGGGGPRSGAGTGAAAHRRTGRGGGQGATVRIDAEITRQSYRAIIINTGRKGGCWTRIPP